MTTLTSTLLFKDFCKLLEKIYFMKNKENKAKELSNFIIKFKNNCRIANLDLKENGSFYPIMRLLLPQMDRERGAYGIKEATLAKIYIRILGLSKEGSHAQKLSNFRTTQSAQNAYDFADIAYSVLHGRTAKGNVINIDQLNEHLDKIAQLNAANDPSGIDIELTKLLQKTSQIEQKWIIRILLKDMRLGLGHKRFLNAWHPDAVELFDVCNSLIKVCERLIDSNQRLHEIEVSVFYPFVPMFSQRCDILTVQKCLKDREHIYIETKYDGERFQLHMKEGEFRYFSRGANEYTDTFGANINEGLLTPELAPQINSKCKECILDGEMMGWNKETQLYKTKGDISFDVKKLKPGGIYQPCFCVFDILLYNGEVLTNKSYIDRMLILDTIFTPKQGVIHSTIRHQVTTSREIVSHLNQAIDEHLEGIIIKDPKSVYRPSARNAGWYKIKPEYTEGLMDHLDLIIMGGYYGEGKHRGIISHFLLGIREDNRFLSFCRVGSGYSNAELAELCNNLSPNWNLLKSGPEPPAELVWTREKPDVWVESKKSYILEVKATEITRSKDFAINYTLRFPRVQKIRYEKNSDDCMTIEQFNQLRKEAEGKLYSRHVQLNDGEGPSKPKRKRIERPYNNPVPQDLRHDPSNVSIKNYRLHSKEFCVVSDSPKIRKNSIEKYILENGGKVTQNPGKDTFCLIVGEITIRVKNLIKMNKYDMVRVEWLQNFLTNDDESIEEPDWTPADFIHAKEETKQIIYKHYDKFGDNFRQPATLESLRACFERMEFEHLTQNEMSEIDIEVFSGTSPFSIFRLCKAIFPKKDNYSGIDLISKDFLFYGGSLTTELDDKVTHIILDSSEKLSYWQNINANRPKKLHIISNEWIKESIRLKIRLSEHDFPIQS